MSAQSGEIPLLPLSAVLFPGTFLPIQAAEETHRALLRACVRDGQPVGVVMTPGEPPGAHSSIPCVTGCLASVALLADTLDEFDDGPIGVVLYGERRIRILDFIQQDPYLTGRVEYLEEFGGMHVEKRTTQAAKLFAQYLYLIRKYYEKEVLDLKLPTDPTTASYLLASVLCLPLEVKQRWLESVSTRDRLEEQVAYLKAECDKHEVLLQLATRMQHQFSTPDPRLYLAYYSPN